MREEMIRKTAGALETELDDLRDALMEGLTRYEGQLREQCERLPSWLALTFQEIWPLFCFSEEGPAPDAALGPRVIALAAGDLEDFIERWMGDSLNPRIHHFAQDPTLLQRYIQSRESVEQLLDDLLLESEQVAQRARETLNYWRDDILAELEDSRIRDIDAIELLVAEGTLESGRDARAEIALLWEEQRRRAGALLRAWEPFEGLLTQGLELSRDGIEELQALLQDAHKGMAQAYPTIARNGAQEAIIPTSVHEDPFASTQAPLLQPSKTSKPHTHSPDLIFAPSPRDAEALDDFDPYNAPSDDQALPFAFDDHFDDTPITDEPPPPFEFEDGDDEPLIEPSPTLALDAAAVEDEPMINFGDEDDAPEAIQDAGPTGLFIIPGEHFGREEEVDLKSKPLVRTPERQPAAQTPLSSIPFILDEPSASPSPSPTSTPLPAPPRKLEQPAPTPKLTPKPALTPPPAMLLDEPEHDDEIEDAGVTGEVGKAGEVEDAEVETLLTITRDELRRDDIGPDPEPGAEETQRPLEQISAAADEGEDEDEDEPLVAPEPEPAKRPKRDKTKRQEPTQDPHDDATDEPSEDEPVNAKAKPAAEPASWSPGWHSAPLETTAQRAIDQLAPLNKAVFALTFVAPLLLVLGTLLLSAASRYSPNLPNPLHPSPNMAHFIGVALLLWLMACPWVMRWQITWHGWRPMLWRQIKLREEADIVLSQEHIELGPWLLPWEQLEEVSLERWDDIEQGTQGWALSLMHQGQLYRISALASDEPIWAQAGEPITSPPREAWRMPQRPFNMLCEALLGRSTGDI